MILGWSYTPKALKSTVKGTVWDDKLHLHKIISSQHCLEAIAKYYVFKDALPYFFLGTLKRFGIPYWKIIHP